MVSRSLSCWYSPPAAVHNRHHRRRWDRHHRRRRDGHHRRRDRHDRSWRAQTDTAGTGTTASATGGSAADACAADEFGCVEYAEGEPITIGSLLVISGANASLGPDSQYGVELAVDYIDGSFDGEAGQFKGRDLAFNHQDDGCSAEGGQAGAQSLASDEKVVAVIGTSCSSAALGVADTILSERGSPSSPRRTRARR